MKRLMQIALLGSLVTGAAHAEPLSQLFESSQLWDVGAKPAAASAKTKRSRVSASRNVASVVAPQTQTYVYGDDYSFAKNVKTEVTRDLASVAMKGRVISVRREIPLTEASSKEVKQEFLINAGSRLGLAKGTKLKVYRNVPVVDPFNGNKQHELKVDFATVEVVHVEDDVAVTQLVKLTEAGKGSYVNLRGILVGDYVSVY